MKTLTHHIIRLNPGFIASFRLTKLQKELIKALVLYGPASATRLAKITRRHYESIWRSLGYMEGKGLVQVAETKRGSTKRLKKLFQITGMAFQGLFDIDPELLYYMGSWIYTLREISSNRLVEALVYLPHEDRLTRVIIPASDKFMELARKVAMSMPHE